MVKDKININANFRHSTSFTRVSYCADMMPDWEANRSAGTGRTAGDLPRGLFTFYLC